MTFGYAISEARKKLGLSQKDLATKIIKEDKTAISPQYLNDLEHDRRYPPSDDLLQQFADILKIDLAYLQYLAGNFPKDIQMAALKPDQFNKAIKAFRKAIKDENK